LIQQQQQHQQRHQQENVLSQILENARNLSEIHMRNSEMYSQAEQEMTSSNNDIEGTASAVEHATDTAASAEHAQVEREQEHEERRRYESDNEDNYENDHDDNDINNDDDEDDFDEEYEDEEDEFEDNDLRRYLEDLILREYVRGGDDEEAEDARLLDIELDMLHPPTSHTHVPHHQHHQHHPFHFDSQQELLRRPIDVSSEIEHEKMMM